MFKPNVMGVILAGGAGERLEELTSDVRAQPAVPFGGKYRIIDFIISSFFNSQIKKLYVLIQHKSLSLVDHIKINWANRFGSKDEYIRVTGPMPPHWQKGTADSVYQNLSRIKIENPDYVAIFGGDHVCNMNVSDVIDFHKNHKADLTICAMKYPIKDAVEKFGIIDFDKNKVMTHFEEKTKSPKPAHGEKDYTWVSLGHYIFNKDLLVDSLEKDAKIADSESKHDFGRDIIPMIFKNKKAKICVYDIGECKYAYRYGIDSVDKYYSASMDFIAKSESLCTAEWPIYSVNTDNLPPARFLKSEKGEETEVKDSIITDGCLLKGCEIENSILFPSVSVESDSEVKKSILFNDVKIGKKCYIENAIIDKRVSLPDGTVIKDGKINLPPLKGKAGELLKTVREKSFVTKSKIVVVPCYHDYRDKN